MPEKYKGRSTEVAICNPSSAERKKWKGHWKRGKRVSGSLEKAEARKSILIGRGADNKKGNVKLKNVRGGSRPFNKRIKLPKLMIEGQGQTEPFWGAKLWSEGQIEGGEHKRDGSPGGR